MVAKLAAIDIETTGLSPLDCKVVSVAIATDDETVVWENADEATMLADLATWITSPSRTPGVFVTWNGSAFDWPFLATRAAVHNSPLSTLLHLVPSADRTPRYGAIGGHDCGYLVNVGGWDHLDAMLPWRPIAKARGISAGLKPVSRSEGIEVIEVDRERISDLTRAELMAYNVSDVAATLELARRLGDQVDTWMDSAALVGLAALDEKLPVVAPT
jgi:uncharacterized protein YprB with RNaseH-like and TPR domain